MPWPKNSNDLKWFKKNTMNQIVVMGSKTWEDPFMPTPLNSRVNILITNKDNSYYPGADAYFKDDISNKILSLEKKYLDKDIFIIGGPEIIKQTFDLLKEFYKLTGCPVLINTSFNIRGEPIVESVKDAFNCFMGTNLDILICGNYYLEKEKQIIKKNLDYKDKFSLD